MANQLLQYLPAVLQEDAATRDFLKAFARILLGGDDDVTAILGSNPLGLEQIIDGFAGNLTLGDDASNGAPDQFLPWLSQWVALSVRTDISQNAAKDNAIRRKFIGRMTQLYRYRGTKKSMAELLAIFTSRDVAIKDQIDGKPHYFEVVLNLEAIKASDSKEDYDRAKELAHSVIRLEKPAHTRYLLIPAVTTIRIGQRQAPPPANTHLPTDYFIKVGVNTRLGATPKFVKPIH